MRLDLEFCPRCGSGPRQKEDTVECPDCGYRWSGPRLRDLVESEVTMEKVGSHSVGEDFPRQQARVRELLEGYESIGPGGRLGAVILKGVLARAEEAAISGDVIAILRSYEELKGCE